MIKFSSTVFYNVSIGILCIFSIWWFRYLLSKIEKRQKKNISKVKEFSPITTESPLKYPKRSARKIALEGLVTQYSIKCWIAAWANSPSDAWLLKSGIRKDLIRELQTLGIKTHTHEIQYDKENLKN